MKVKQISLLASLVLLCGLCNAVQTSNFFDWLTAPVVEEPKVWKKVEEVFEGNRKRCRSIQHATTHDRQ